MDKLADGVVAPKVTRNTRPRNAATLILLDLDGTEPRVLMGRRSEKLAFMPGVFVFPGGRTDRTDHAAPRTGTLPAIDLKKLVDGMGARGSARKAEAIALSAIRETREETGLLIGKREESREVRTTGVWSEFVENGVTPDLSALRYVARAITPPGRVRRFDTRFFAGTKQSIANPQGLIAEPREELDEVAWIELETAFDLPLAAITKAILGTVRERLVEDPDLSRDRPVPCHTMRYGKYHHSFE